MSYAPIALFVYNRPEHTRRTVEALNANAEAVDSALYIFSDAPRNSAASSPVAEIREYIHTISGFQSVTVIEREYNFGLANSVISGVTQLCEQYGQAIVLEDDLLVSEYFLAYMNQALETYKGYDEVMQISGYMFPVEVDIEEDAFFLPLTTSWGWATWQRAWQKFDPSASGYARLNADCKLRKAFDLDGAYPYYKMLESQFNGEVDSWAIRWYLNVFLSDGLVLYPKRSLVLNAGMDGSGTHGDTLNDKLELICDFKVRTLPTELRFQHECLDKISHYFKNKRSNRFWNRLKSISPIKKRSEGSL